MRVIDRESPDAATRDQLVMEHVGLVKAMASRLAQPAAAAGRGLRARQRRRARAHRRGRPVQAVARRAVQRLRPPAHPRRDARLAARPRLGAARRLRKLRRDVDARHRDAAPHDLGREPEAADIAAALGVSEPEYDRCSTSCAAPSWRRSASRRVDAKGGTTLDVEIEPAEGPHARLEREELRELLAGAIGELPERERHILALYYEEELTLAEIGEVIGVGESRVSQLRTQAIARLRSLAWRGADAEKDATLSRERRILRRTRSTRCCRRAGAGGRRRRRCRRSVIRYNFRRPDRISKEQIHSLHFLHERFARNVSHVAVGLPAVDDRAVAGVGGAVRLLRVPDVAAGSDRVLRACRWRRSTSWPGSRSTRPWPSR